MQSLVASYQCEKEVKMRKLTKEIAKLFDIAVIDKTQKIWFVRTNGGIYYNDYYFNNFIGLGWDKISKQVVLSNQTQERKKAIVEECYPDEKRPGLILGQLNAFYCKMQVGDLVLIPSLGGSEVSIGIVGDLITNVNHAKKEEEYHICEYLHKRSISWIKRVNLYEDVYLFRALRGQQTISEITNYADLVFRNLYPAYVSNDSLHLMLKKTSEKDYSLRINASLCSSIISIDDKISCAYGVTDFEDTLKIKTAVGSPGFIEIIADLVPHTTITIGVIYHFIVGKIKSDGSASGLLGILNSVNTLINDHVNRKKANAEALLIKAQTKKEEAETEKIKIETELLKQQLTTIDTDTEKQTIMNIQTECENIIREALVAGIVCETRASQDKAS